MVGAGLDAKKSPLEDGNSSTFSTKTGAGPFEAGSPAPIKYHKRLGVRARQSRMEGDHLAGEEMLSGLGPAVLAVMFVLVLAVWIYQGFAMMAIAKRSKTPNGWLGFIPIANVYLLTQIGKQSGWWTLGIIAALIPVIGVIAVLALTIFLWWKACEVLKRPTWWSIMQAIPIVNLIFLGIMAWGE
jgi:hypothetical protein